MARTKTERRASKIKRNTNDDNHNKKNLQDGLYVHSSPPKVVPNSQGSVGSANIREYLRGGNIAGLEDVVLEGHGHKLLNRSAIDPRVRAFLKTLPSFMSKIDLVHDATERGNLRDLKSLLDRRKLARSKDSQGLGLLHKAVLYGHADIVEYLVTNYPETATTTDHEQPEDSVYGSTTGQTSAKTSKASAVQKANTINTTTTRTADATTEQNTNSVSTSVAKTTTTVKNKNVPAKRKQTPAQMELLRKITVASMSSSGGNERDANKTTVQDAKMKSSVNQSERRLLPPTLTNRKQKLDRDEKSVSSRKLYNPRRKMPPIVNSYRNVPYHKAEKGLIRSAATSKLEPLQPLEVKYKPGDQLQEDISKLKRGVLSKVQSDVLHTSGNRTKPMKKAKYRKSFSYKSTTLVLKDEPYPSSSSKIKVYRKVLRQPITTISINLAPTPTKVNRVRRRRENSYRRHLSRLSRSRESTDEKETNKIGLGSAKVLKLPELLKTGDQSVNKLKYKITPVKFQKINTENVQLTSLDFAGVAVNVQSKYSDVTTKEDSFQQEKVENIKCEEKIEKNESREKDSDESDELKIDNLDILSLSSNSPLNIGDTTDTVQMKTPPSTPQVLDLIPLLQPQLSDLAPLLQRYCRRLICSIRASVYVSLSDVNKDALANRLAQENTLQTVNEHDICYWTAQLVDRVLSKTLDEEKDVKIDKMETEEDDPSKLGDSGISTAESNSFDNDEEREVISRQDGENDETTEIVELVADDPLTQEQPHLKRRESYVKLEKVELFADELLTREQLHLKRRVSDVNLDEVLLDETK